MSEIEEVENVALSWEWNHENVVVLLMLRLVSHWRVVLLRVRGVKCICVLN